MHLIEPIRLCIDEIIQSAGSGIKSMILDDFTTGVISSGYTKSEMLLREVFLFEQIDTIFESIERLNHVKCIVILRPTKDNIERLCRELGRPHYRTYNVYFTNRIGATTIEKLAEADETEVVRCVLEIPLDFQPIQPFLFHLKIINKTFNLATNNWLPESLKRSTDGLVSALIALQVNPLIRYQTQSPLCKVLAEKVSNQMRNESIMNKPWRRVAPVDCKAVLVIIDRRYDLITPIVNKWTYYPLIHELFDIKQNRIDLTNTPDRRPKDPKEMLISLENDQFFDENYHKSYGELGVTLKSAVENLRTVTKSHDKLDTMEDMKRFIDEYPETRRYASNLHCHVFLMSELTRLVTTHNLMAVSECEQELACNMTSHSEILKKLKQLVPSTTIRPIDALRLVSLYTICRSEKSLSNINELIKMLTNRKDLDPSEIEFVKHLRNFNSSKAQNPLFDETVQHVTRMIVQNVKGVENVLTQYKPNVGRIIDDMRRSNGLKEAEFAFCGERYRDEPPKRIILFFVGGVTYDEALVADQYNRLSPSVSSQQLQIIVGGTSVHNFNSFIDEVSQSMSQPDLAI